MIFFIFGAALILTLAVGTIFTRQSQLTAGQSRPDKVEYLSSADNTLQPALFYKPDVHQPVPLLVALHSWSGNYLQASSTAYADWCIENNWAFIYPDFRGPNNRPVATGSDLVIKDILSAVEYARNNANIDPNRIYLVGASGGGYTALMVSAKHPDIWAAVSVWVPITDLSTWYFESEHSQANYAADIVNSLGGPPGYSPEVDLAYKNRSPITWLNTSLPVQMDINAGIHDGTVPISHSLMAFNALAAPEDRLSEEEIRYFVEHAQVPPHLNDPSLFDISYGEKAPLFRRQSGNARITIFNGVHEMLYTTALTWLEQQQN
jgi:dipeptidyl aminopeptidase/acylaminoacyl peptidase